MHRKIVSLLFLAPAIFSAQASTLTLDEAYSRVLQENPQLNANRIASAVADERIRQAIQKPQTGIKLEAQNFLGTGPFSTIDGLEATVTVNRLWEPPASYSARKQLAEENSAVVSVDNDIARLDALAKAAHHFIHVAADHKKLEIARDHLALTEKMHSIIKNRVDAGRSHVAELRKANIEVARADIALEHASHEIETSKTKLAASWGSRTVDFNEVAADLYILPDVKPLETLITELARNPRLEKFTQIERINRAQLKLASAQEKPPIDFSAGVRYFNDSQDGALVFSANIPLGSVKRSKPFIEEQRLISQMQPLQKDELEIELYQQLFDMYQELSHAKTAFNVLTQRILPDAKLAAAEYEDGYNRGRFSLLELAAAQQTLLQGEQEKLASALRYHQLRIDIEHLTGASLGREQ